MKGMIIAPGLDNFVSLATIDCEKPDYIAFLTTSETTDLITDILKATKADLKAYKKFFIKDIFSTVETIQEFFNAFYWLSEECKVLEVVVDATNCITVIEMASYLSAGFLEAFRELIGEKVKIKLVYTHSDYKMVNGVGMEVEGTQRVIEMEHPLDSLGFILAISAINQFNSYNYVQTRDIFRILEKNSTSDNSFLYSGLCKLSEAFNLWDKFEIDGAIQILGDAIEAMKKIRHKTFAKNLASELELKRRVLSGMSPEKITLHNIVDVFENGERRFEECKFDDALARYYACLEMISRYSLTKYGIDMSKPDYSKLPEEAVDRFKEKSGGNLPVELELKKGFLLLSCLEDPIGDKMRDLGEKFIGLLRFRNLSILAHGNKPVSERNAKSFRDDLVVNFLSALTKAENANLEELEIQHKHTKLPKNIKEMIHEIRF